MIPDISYLILNYNPEGESQAAEILEKTMDAFYERKSKNLSCEVFLLDQGSVPGHRAWLLEKQSRHQFSLILLDHNIGISGAINRMARTCKSPVLGLITSDVIITSGMDEDLYGKVQIEGFIRPPHLLIKATWNINAGSRTNLCGADPVRLESLQKQKSSLLDSLLARSPKIPI